MGSKEEAEVERYHKSEERRPTTRQGQVTGVQKRDECVGGMNVRALWGLSVLQGERGHRRFLQSQLLLANG